jgi:hypothetical protein
LTAVAGLATGEELATAIWDARDSSSSRKSGHTWLTTGEEQEDVETTGEEQEDVETTHKKSGQAAQEIGGTGLHGPTTNPSRHSDGEKRSAAKVSGWGAARVANKGKIDSIF